VPTLAEKNHNPLNMRPLSNGEKWVGQTGVDTNPVSGSFCVFVDNIHGVRAATINLRSYVQKAGVRTIKDAIFRWAPPNVAAEVAHGVGNHTEAYLSRVCHDAGIAPDYSLKWLGTMDVADDDMPTLAKIIRSMNRVEAGAETITQNDTEAGIKLALGIK
jgi:hypothetical protein